MPAITTSIRCFGALPVFALLALAGCNDTESGTPAAGRLNVVHAAAYAPTAVNVTLDEQDAKVLYAGQSAGYSELSAGTHTLRAAAAATPASQVSLPLTISSRKYYSVYVYSSSPTELAALSLTDDLTVPSTGKAHLRFINLGYEVPRATLSSTRPTAVPYATDVAARSNTGFLVVSPDTVTLRATQPGGTVLATTAQPVVFRAGKIYNVLLRGAAATATTPSSFALSVEELQPTN